MNKIFKEIDYEKHEAHYYGMIGDEKIEYSKDVLIDELQEENQRLNNVLNELERHLEQEILEWKDCSDGWTKAQVQEDKIILDKLVELKESDKL